MLTLINSETAAQTIRAYFSITRKNRKTASHFPLLSVYEIRLIFLSLQSPRETNSLSKQAGVLLLGTSGVIPPMAIEHMETHCRIDEDKKLIPFAFRTHTHSLGKVVSGYRIRDGKWQLLGKRDPQKPQMFFPINATEPIVKGDILAARCTMSSNRMRPTYIG